MVEAVSSTPGRQDESYEDFLAEIQRRFLARVTSEEPSALFTTTPVSLWQAFLEDLPEEHRQHHTCHACRRFVERYGGLVTIAPDGRTSSAIWDPLDGHDLYRRSFQRMRRLVERSNVTGVFLSCLPVWGQPQTGSWRHFAVTPPPAMVYENAVQTAGQRMAEKREEFITVSTALREFNRDVVDTALQLLESDSLYRSEKVIGPARWLRKLHCAVAAAQGSVNKINVVWRAVAAALSGFCHPRSSMIGTLLEDIAAGMDFQEVSRRFQAKMHPLQYQRPQAAPAAGAIAAAEKLVEQLGIARSLPRRFARLDEVQALWKPAEARKEAAAEGGVFGHLQPKGMESCGPTIVLAPITMTWEKFSRTVLPAAERIEFWAPSTRTTFATLVTAVNADAPPILQWDHVDRRNPVSWYFHHGGSTPEQFSLKSGEWHQVSAVTLQPSMWHGGPEHQGAGVMFVIQGAKDLATPGACLFPEILKSELHGVRSVIEAYSRTARIDGAEQASAAGVMFQKGQGKPWDNLFRVMTAWQSVKYRLDRWD